MLEKCKSQFYETHRSLGLQDSKDFPLMNDLKVGAARLLAGFSATATQYII